MEDELWEFMEKNVLSVLMLSKDEKHSSGPHSTATPTRNALYDYVNELFDCLRNAEISEVKIIDLYCSCVTVLA